MKKISILILSISVSLAFSACGGGSAPANNAPKNTGNATSNASKPEENKAANTATAKAPEPKTELKDEKATKPKGESKKVEKDAKIPANWVYYSDEVKGYGFSLPEGSKGDSTSADGVDAFVASTPDDIGIIVFAFKDKTLTKEDLLNRAEAAMNAMGEKITAGKLEGESDDYAVAEATSEGKDGKSKMKILVGTDVTDNYVMFVGTDEAKYESKKATIDEIWGSFEMYSGGASGGN